MDRMAVSADVLRLHLDYTAWATGLLLDAVSELSPEELTRDFHTADKSVLGTLVHAFAADRLWFSRVSGAPIMEFVTEADFDLGVLRTEWPVVQQWWKEWAAGMTDQSAQATLAYKDMAGRPWEQPLWQMVLHVVNHGTHHRGQVSGFLRAMGRTPPGIDLVYFYRQLGS
jgi:uncharacterized damage-inducible protein DinB